MLAPRRLQPLLPVSMEAVAMAAGCTEHSAGAGAGGGVGASAEPEEREAWPSGL